MKVSKQSKVMLLAAGLALLAPSAMKAQQPADARAAERAAAFAKSQQIQSDLAAISGNRAGAEAALISQWQSVLDPNVYDLEREIGPIAARAIDWQLYGASKVNDFSQMIDVLRGRIGAGNFLGERGPGDPNVFGNSLEELVYTPIAPCRVVDTRGVGARTGVLGAGVARTFDLTTDGFAEGQGGSAACPGLPSFSHFGWAVNVTVTGNAGNGWLTIWPFSGTEPVASQVNYAAGIWSVANGLNLTGCNGCADDVTIRANLAGTHVIIDVLGFYQRPTVFTSAFTEFAGPATNVGSNSGNFVFGAICPAGTTATSGDVDYNGFDVAIGEHHYTGNRFSVWMINRDAGTVPVTVTSRCVDTPIYAPS